MIFAYKYVSGHPFERLHQYIEHTVLQVWCQPSGPFNLALLDPDFRKLVKSVNAKYLLTPIEQVYEICRNDLTPHQRQIIADGFIANNKVAQLCAGSHTPLRYADIATFHKPLSKLLALFFSNLYTKLLSLKPVKDQCGELVKHFQQFTVLNQQKKCGFCGLDTLKGEYQANHGKRNAYDHYLPKGLYPFSSVNLQNLAPACSECNSGHKLAKDPIRNGRRAFYPYSLTPPDVRIQLTLKSNDVGNLNPTDIDLIIDSLTHPDEVKSWLDVFNIMLRYTDFMNNSREIKSWLDTILYGADSHPDFHTYFVKLLNGMDMNREQDTNFLRRPFLEACQTLGLIH